MLACLGARLASEASFDAFPEFAPPRVELQTEAPGLSSEEVEALVTTPLESALGGTPGLKQMRSKSVLGLSSIVILFAPHTDLLQARALVQERLGRVAASLPAVARPPVLLSPLSSTSRLLKIGMWSKTKSQLEQTDLARWVVRPRLMAIPGIANVAIWGERDRQLQVRIEPERLAAHNVSSERLLAVMRDALAPRAGGFVDGPTQRLSVIHPALVQSAAELAQVPLVLTTPANLASDRVASAGASALTIGDVAEVVEDHAPPIGEGLVTRGPGLLLIVEKHPGGNSLALTRQIDAALAALAPALPGIELDATIFRPASFIERALSNLGEAMGLGCALVILVLFLFLWNIRTAIVSVTALPLSLFAATAVLTALDRTIDTMVIAGLAIALGEVVDDAIIDVENIHRRLELERASGPLGPTRTLQIVLEASLEVRSAIVYASMIVMLVFVPVVFLDGVAGDFFRPLALAYGLAVLASTLVALTVTPALALLLLPKGPSVTRPSPIARSLSRRYLPLLRAALARPRSVLAATGVALLSAGIALSGLSEQFLPSFQENDFLMHWIARPGTSLAAVARSANLARAELLGVPGVRNFGSHIGRAEVADEVVGPNFAELWISVDPRFDLKATLAKVREVVDGYPGVYRDVQTYLQERMREVLTGGSGSLVVRLYGADLSELRSSAASLSHQLESIAGVAHAKSESQVLVPQIEVVPDLPRCAALNVDPGLVRSRVSLLVQGERAGQLVRGQQPIDVVLWGVESVRNDVQALRDLAIVLDDQRTFRLGDLARVRIVPMLNTIAHDAGSRKLDLTIDLTPQADLASIARQTAELVAAYPFAAGHHAELLGEYQARSTARRRLGLVSLFALLGIVLVLLADFRSWRPTLLVLASLPFALVGGVLAAMLTGGVVSLGTLIGLVTVIGIAARNGIMLIAHLRHLEREEEVPFGLELVLRGAAERLVPIVMTALATALALLPLVLHGDAPGHEIEHPMAVVILGGVISSTLLNLVVLPVLYLRFGHSAHRDITPETLA
ncbi:MAG: heavy metal efflux pump [Myxococcaceae bacterium]|nr:heavy metal efflux pump [Myxococcaceae bacterium]